MPSVNTPAVSTLNLTPIKVGAEKYTKLSCNKTGVPRITEIREIIAQLIAPRFKCLDIANKTPNTPPRKIAKRLQVRVVGSPLAINKKSFKNKKYG